MKPPPPLLGSPPPPPDPAPPPALKMVREWEGVGVWPVATAPPVAVASQPTAVADHASAGRMSWACWAGDFAAKGWDVAGISVRA